MVMDAFSSKNLDMCPPMRSSNVPLHASATLDVPEQMVAERYNKLSESSFHCSHKEIIPMVIFPSVRL